MDGAAVAGLDSAGTISPPAGSGDCVLAGGGGRPGGLEPRQFHLAARVRATGRSDRVEEPDRNSWAATGCGRRWRNPGRSAFSLVSGAVERRHFFVYEWCERTGADRIF